MTPEQATDITAITQLVVRERESRDLCLTVRAVLEEAFGWAGLTVPE